MAYVVPLPGNGRTLGFLRGMGVLDSCLGQETNLRVVTCRTIALSCSLRLLTGKRETMACDGHSTRHSPSNAQAHARTLDSQVSL
eukprot:scaffold9373_cov107-Isochrysis_galbana.AAC.1